MSDDELIEALRVSNRRPAASRRQPPRVAARSREPPDRLARLQAALNRIAERTGSEDPCRWMVELAREALRK